eukprot:scaffold5.g781.t1
MASDPIPVFTDLGPVYGDDTAEATERYKKLKAAFAEKFGAPPEVFARSPGRVNLIGEHIDYEGYAVLPMALALDTVVAVRKGGDSLVISNLEGGKYPDMTFPADPDQARGGCVAVDVGKHNWANYFLAAYKGVFEHLASKGDARPPLSGLQVMVHGRVPTGGGLSSSAAIVCASAMAVMHVHGIEFTKGEVSEFTAAAERYVGVTSGGMDQAISVMGKPGTALLVEFNPVRASDVRLPDGAAFVIANSLAVSNKAEGATGRYNLRVVECRLAAAVLAVALGESQEAARRIQARARPQRRPPHRGRPQGTLKEVEPLLDAKAGDPGAGVAALLHEQPYATAELEGLLGAPLTSMFAGNASALRVLGARSEFALRQRAAHVYAEKARVLAFRDVANGELPAEEKLARLGQLMDESQASCSDLYECSCPELSVLVGVAKGAGAVGARLTGAGWGGCTVSLVRTGEVEGFIRKVTEGYYRGLIEAGRITEADLPDVIFASRPSSGGAVLRLQL